MKTCQRSKVASRCESTDGLLCLVPFFLLHLYRSHMIEWVYSQWCTVTLCSFMQTHHQHFSLFWFEGTKRLPSRHEDAAVTWAERERARWLEHLLMNHNIIMLVLTKCVLLQASCWRRRPAAEASWMFIFLFPVEFSGGFVGRTGSRSLRVFFFFH